MANPNHRMRSALDADTEAIVATLKVLADARRLKLLGVLEVPGELQDSDLYAKVQIEPLDGSYHVGVLRVAKIVEARRRPGKRFCYALTEYGRKVLRLATQMKPA